MRDIFPIQMMSPGEYVVKHGSTAERCFGYEQYRFADETTDRWIQAVYKILSSDVLTARVRERYGERMNEPG